VGGVLRLVPLCLAGLLVGLEGGAHPRRYSKGTVLSTLLQGLGEGTPHISSAPTQGHPSHRRSASPCFATESVCTIPWGRFRKTWLHPTRTGAKGRCYPRSVGEITPPL